MTDVNVVATRITGDITYQNFIIQIDISAHKIWQGIIQLII